MWFGGRAKGQLSQANSRPPISMAEHFVQPSVTSRRASHRSSQITIIRQQSRCLPGKFIGDHLFLKAFWITRVMSDRYSTPPLGTHLSGCMFPQPSWNIIITHDQPAGSIASSCCSNILPSAKCRKNGTYHITPLDGYWPFAHPLSLVINQWKIYHELQTLRNKESRYH